MNNNSVDLEYKNFIEIVKRRRTCREFSSDPIPDDSIEKILEPARWAMSGANSQPWEFIVVKDKSIKEQLFDAYVNINMDFTFWMEQQRRFELRHPGFQVPVDGDPEEALKIKQTRRLWKDAPVVIAVIGDCRKQWGTIVGAHTFSLGQTHFTDGLANACTMIHLAASALGLTSQWVSIHVEEPFKRILNMPDLYKIHTLIPIGYPSQPLKGGYRENLTNMVHFDTYDRNRCLSNKDIIERLEKLRNRTSRQYSKMFKD